MGQVVRIVDADIIAEVTADDGAVVQADGPAEVMELEEEGGQLADADEAEEFAVLDELRVEIVGYQDVVPVGGGVAVANQHFDFKGRQLAVADAAAVLYIPQVIFVFPFGEIAAIDELVA